MGAGDPKQIALDILGAAGASREKVERIFNEILNTSRAGYRTEKAAIRGKERDAQHKLIARQARRLHKTLVNANPYVIWELSTAGLTDPSRIHDRDYPTDRDWRDFIEDVAIAAETVASRPRPKKKRNGHRNVAYVCVAWFEYCRNERATGSSTGDCRMLYDAVCDHLGVDEGIDRERYLREALARRELRRNAINAAAKQV